MIKWLKKTMLFLVCVVFTALGIRFGPNLYVQFFGNPQSQWISETYTQNLRERNELVVYELEVTGQETFTQDAWLIGTVQKVEMPYTFTMAFVIDMTQANVVVEGSEIEVRVPAPQARYPKLVVDEERMRKNDWLYPLTPERYAEIKTTVEEKLVGLYASNTQYVSEAWNRAVYNLEELFAPLTTPGLLSVEYELKVVQANE